MKQNYGGGAKCDSKRWDNDGGIVKVTRRGKYNKVANLRRNVTTGRLKCDNEICGGKCQVINGGGECNCINEGTKCDSNCYGTYLMDYNELFLLL